MSNRHRKLQPVVRPTIGPCPFCGRSVARLVEAPDWMAHYVACDNPCYARGPIHEGDMAIRLWNNGFPHGGEQGIRAIHHKRLAE